MENLLIVLGVGIVVALFMGLIYMIDEDLYEKLVSWIKKPASDFLAKVRNPQQRAQMTLKENWVLWLSWSFFGLVFGLWFYIAGIGAVVLIKGLNYFGLRKTKQEDNDKLSNIFTSVQDSVIGFIARSINAEERKKMDVDEYIMFMMISTLPFNLPFGVYFYAFAIALLVGIIVAEKLSGYKFANFADMKEKLSRQILADKEEEIAALKAKIADFESTMEMSVSDVTRRIEAENKMLKKELEEKGILISNLKADITLAMETMQKLIDEKTKGKKKEHVSSFEANAKTISNKE